MRHSPAPSVRLPGQFLGVLPAGTWVGRPPVLALVALAEGTCSWVKTLAPAFTTMPPVRTPVTLNIFDNPPPHWVPEGPTTPLSHRPFREEKTQVKTGEHPLNTGNRRHTTGRDVAGGSIANVLFELHVVGMRNFTRHERKSELPCPRTKAESSAEELKTVFI